METRTLGRTGLKVSALGFGCGAVGGLMVRGEPADQRRAVARAIELGINYFDTAPQYGDGASERNLGRVLRELTVTADIFVGTKIRVAPGDYDRLAQAIPEGLEASLKRLGRESVDLFQLHNAIAPESSDEALSLRAVLGEVVPAFELLREQGKTQFLGITAVGDTASLQQVIASQSFDTAQISYNMLNPSAGAAVPAGYPAQDYGDLIGQAHSAGMGVINIRVLAGGALSGSEARHAIASPPPAPIGSGHDYGIDVERARRLAPLVEQGFAADLVEASLRFSIANPGVSTVLIGMARIEELEHAAAAVNKGPLPPEALRQLAVLQGGFVGEAR
jgi:aryl-alcohol dehydrogenase-like predicted oxidoreductase